MSESQINKVVDLNAPRPSPGAAELLGRVREAGIAKLGGLFKAALDQVDDSLFGYSEKSDTGASRSQFFDAMRDLRIKRPAMERVFQDSLANRFAEFGRSRGKSTGTATVTASVEADSLSLVEDSDLEETLAINGMGAKAATRYNSVLYALNQRLAAVVGAKEVTDAGNPLGPQSVCGALQAALHEFGADVSVKLVLLKLLDRHVAGELDQLYDESNRMMANAGILPNIKYTLPARGPSAAAPVKPGSAAAGVAGVAGASGVTVDPNVASEIMTTLASLFAARRRAERGGEDLIPAGPSLSDRDLIAALALLQSQLAEAESFAQVAISPVEQVDKVKHNLIEQLRRSGVNEPDRRVASADEDAIDLVSMMFQFVVQDRNLPAEIQAVLGRLQIPYVRVAIKDKHLFAQKEHPARMLLNALAMGSVGWSKESDRDARLLGQLNQTVDRVVREYNDDFALFETLTAEFEAFISQQKKRSEIAEQRATETARGRERLSQARREATQAIKTRMGDHQLPPLVRDTLLNPWTNYLVLTHLRQGVESADWKSAINFVDALVWAVQPKANDQERARLRALLPQLQTFLRRGLSVVDFHHSDIDRLVHGLAALIDTLHATNVNLDSVSAVAVAEAAVQASAATHAPAAADEEDESAASIPVLPEDDEYLLRVRAMKVGTWIEFLGEEDQHERAKLSWISTINARFLFVNRKGLKVAERNLFVLANELREGRAVILEAAPIFDRALDTIMKRMRTEYSNADAEKAKKA